MYNEQLTLSFWDFTIFPIIYVLWYMYNEQMTLGFWDFTIFPII
jgi:hypothetical protein